MTCSGCQQVKKSKEARKEEVVKRVKKKKVNKKTVQLKNKNKKNGDTIIPPLKIKLSPYKSGQKYSIKKSDKKAQKARKR